jgi:transcriptional regulator with XRE-family HTH domain
MDGHELRRRFGNKVRELRDAKGLTQEQLADRIGRSVDTVSNIERGLNATRLETAHQLADVLGIRLRDLFDLDDERDPGERERDQAIEAVAELLRSRNPGTIRRVKELVEVGLKLTDAQ